MLQIKYKTKKLERICTEYAEAKKQHGDNMAGYIHQRIDELKSAESVEMLVKFGIGRCHALSGDRKGQYAMTLVHPFRLVFEKIGSDIRLVRIIRIEDYH